MVEGFGFLVVLVELVNFLEVWTALIDSVVVAVVVAAVVVVVVAAVVVVVVAAVVVDFLFVDVIEGFGFLVVLVELINDLEVGIFPIDRSVVLIFVVVVIEKFQFVVELSDGCFEGTDLAHEKEPRLGIFLLVFLRVFVIPWMFVLCFVEYFPFGSRCLVLTF